MPEDKKSEIVRLDIFLSYKGLFFYHLSGHANSLNFCPSGDQLLNLIEISYAGAEAQQLKSYLWIENLNLKIGYMLILERYI